MRILRARAFAAAPLAGLLLLAGCMTMAEGSAPAASSTLVGVKRIGRCHMGGCSWFRVEDFAMVRETPDMALLRVTLREGSSTHGNGRPPRENSNAAIAWNAQPSETYILCSSSRPALIERAENGRWEAVRMDLVTTAGAMESAAAQYAAVCHPGEDWHAEGF
ncbi:MAG TPA: hypothetical protein VGB54_11535, partial [Allosphingosinicella sp.]